jgi:N-acetylglutamate synthase-like GNAT family acetyltransferase
MIRPATEQDYSQVCALLQSESLPIVDLEKELPHFFVKMENDGIVGSIGLELYERSALLRSMIVNPAYRNKGIASELVHELASYAKGKGVKNLFLITNTAENYFRKQGFIRIERENVEMAVLQSKEFNGLCPASSVIMMKKI